MFYEEGGAILEIGNLQRGHIDLLAYLSHYSRHKV